jgi:hypothetical protein
VYAACVVLVDGGWAGDGRRRHFGFGVKER